MFDAPEAAPSEGSTWHVELFDEEDRLTSFLNSVRLRQEQIVSLQFHPFSPTLQRIMLTCLLTDEQVALRIKWEAVERTLHPPAIAVATGGGH